VAEQNDKEPVRLHYARHKLIGGLVISTGLVLGQVWFLAFVEDLNVLRQTILLIATPVMAWIAYGLWSKLQRIAEPAITLSGDGVAVADMTKGTVPWSSIDAVRSRQSLFGSQVVFEVNDQEAHDYLVKRASRLKVATQTLEVSHDELMNTIARLRS
jgi:hypothetical protein